jgi:purine-binding chemotaxis protein CheW
MEKQLVIFELADEFYAVDIACVESIIKMQEITRMPKSPVFVEGVTNLRGKVLPVIDLEKRFDIPAHARNHNTRIMVVNIGQLEVGMIVSAVSEVLTIDDTSIEPAPPMVTTINSNFIAGIARVDSRLVILLDMIQVLSQSERQQTAILVV